jgi:hypothetical protein
LAKLAGQSALLAKHWGLYKSSEFGGREGDAEQQKEENMMNTKGMMGNSGRTLEDEDDMDCLYERERKQVTSR